MQFYAMASIIQYVRCLKLGLRINLVFISHVGYCGTKFSIWFPLVNYWPYFTYIWHKKNPCFWTDILMKISYGLWNRPCTELCVGLTRFVYVLNITHFKLDVDKLSALGYISTVSLIYIAGLFPESLKIYILFSLL